MIRIVAIAVLTCLPTLTCAQGVNQTTRPTTTAIQPRQNNTVVSPGLPTQPAPAPNTFRSPFISPFGTTPPASPPNRGGYSGSTPR